MSNNSLRRNSRHRASVCNLDRTDQERTPQKTTPFPFLQLPGEIRNRIYDLVIPRSHVLIIGAHPQKELQAKRKQYPYEQFRPSRYRLSGRIISIDDEAADPIGLMQSSRAIYEEAMPVFYSKTTPCFDNLKTIHKFLNRVPSTGLENIRAIRLTVSSYGEPGLTKHRQWKAKQDQKWANTCDRIAICLTGLEELELDLTLATWPTTLSTTAEWTRPLMRLKKDGLYSARLTLRHHMFNETRLDLAARKLEDLMMTEHGREERAIREAIEAVREMERKAAVPPRAKKILVIKEQPASSTASKDKKCLPKSKTQPAKTYYRIKGLAGFDRIDLATVGVSWIECGN